MRLQDIKNGLVKGILWVSLFVIFVFITATSLLRIPQVQTMLIQRITGDLKELTGFTFEIGYINLNWFDVLKVNDLKVWDTYDSTMIVIPEARINFSINTILSKKHKNIDKIKITNTRVNLYKHRIDEPINITRFIDTLKYNMAGDGNTLVTIDQIEIDDFEFSFENFTADTYYSGFDMNKFKFNDLNGKIINFSARHDTINFTMHGLTGIEEKTGLPVHQLSSDFTVHQKEMRFANLDLKMGNSHIQDSIVFTYKRMSNLSYFKDSVKMFINLQNSTIFSEDLAWFSKEFREIDDRYQISGEYKGGVTNFYVRNLDLSFGTKGRIRGILSFSGLPNFEETFIDIRLERSFIASADLEQYLGENILSKLSGINESSFTGSFTGFLNDFVADGNFNTNIGEFESDINIKIHDDITSYHGHLTTNAFDIGTFTGIELLETVDLKGSISGNGLTTSNADFVLDAEISRLGINQYDLTNIKTNARFATELFVGVLSVNDPNLRFDAKGSIDLRNHANKINVEANLDTLVFMPLNLTETPGSLSSFIDVDITGLELDSILGEVELRNFYVSYDTNSLELDWVRMRSFFDVDSRSLLINSDVIDIELSGDYTYTKVYKDVLELYKEYTLNLRNDLEDLNAYYSTKQVDEYQDYSMNMQLQLHNLNPVIQLFYPFYHFSEEIIIEGNFKHGYTSILNLNTYADTIQIDKELFVGNLFDLNASKIADSTNVLASIYVSSDLQRYSNKAKTQNLISQTIWDRNEIGFNFSIQQEGLESYADLFGEIVFLPDLTVITLNPSDLQVLNEKWEIIVNNAITISGKEIGFQNVGLQKSEERILLDGGLAENPVIPLTLEFTNVELSNFDPVLTKKLRGAGNGYFKVKNYYNDMLFETNLVVSDFSINDFLVGNVFNKSEWDNTNEKFDLAFQVARNQKNIINVLGVYYPGLEQGLRMSATLDNADLRIGEPFIEDVFSEIQGYVSGEFTVTGNLEYPVLAGTGKISNGGAKINYLNTFYTFEGGVELNNNEIGLRNILIKDHNGSEAIMSGGIFHNGFDDITLDFSGNFTDFMILNTSMNDNDLFYGTGHGSGSISIRGRPSSIVMEVIASTTGDTRIFIPLGGTTEIDKEKFIHFVNFMDDSDQDNEATELIHETVKGMDLKLNLDITHDAYVELIFDVTVGDIIRGRGNGQMNFRLDPNGEFTMYGDFALQEGAYNFTLYNIVNKEFKILPDSKITWLGDPYEGILDISASYEQLASVGPLLDTAHRNAPEIRRRYPTYVILDIQGPLLSPEISFDITIDDYPNSFAHNGEIVNLETELSAVRSEWAINEQELQKQVFSLIILRQFSEKYINTGGTVGRSVSEFVSNQLSYWISQVDENLEIDIDFGDITDETYNTFQMRLSYSFLEGRLRVTRDGGFTNPESQANMASIIGDWSIEYMLTESGNVRIKLFQETNYTTLDRPTVNDYAAIQGGISILYTQSYDEIKEIFNTARKRNKAAPQSSKSTDEKKITSQNTNAEPEKGSNHEEN